MFEVRSSVGNLVDQVFNANDAVLTELLLDDAVVVKRNSVSVDFTVTSLVDKLRDHGPVKVAVGDEGLDSSDHVHGGLVQQGEDTVVDLSDSQQLGDFL